MYRVLHSTPPLHGGAITQIEPGITSTDAYSKPRFALDGDYDSLRVYKRAMLQKYGSEKWQEYAESAKCQNFGSSRRNGRGSAANFRSKLWAGLRCGFEASETAWWPSVCDTSPTSVTDRWPPSRFARLRPHTPLELPVIM